MNSIRAWATALLLGTSLLTTSACGVKEYLNCRDLCDKKKECGSDSNYDVSNCVNVCSDNANSSADYARKVDTCKECVSTLSCNDWKNMLGCYPQCPSLP